MINILIIGGGNIGSRHIQGYLNSKKKISLIIIEPSLKAKKILVNRINEVNFNFKNYKIYNNLNELIENSFFDIVLIATNSDIRFIILKSLIKKKIRFKYIFLEKIAFRNISEFKKSFLMLGKNQIKCFVNLPRRSQPLYKTLKKILKKEKILFFEVNGALNLASNIVHFFDLFYFLTNALIIKNIKLNLKNFGIKKKKFLKFQGNIFLKANNRTFFCFNDNKIYKDVVIKIITKKKCFLIEEEKSIIKIYDKKRSKINKSNYFLQSQLSQQIIDNFYLEKKNTLNLPTLRDSFVAHKATFEFIKLVYKKYNMSLDFLFT